MCAVAVRTTPRVASKQLWSAGSALAVPDSQPFLARVLRLRCILLPGIRVAAAQFSPPRKYAVNNHAHSRTVNKRTCSETSTRDSSFNGCGYLHRTCGVHIHTLTTWMHSNEVAGNAQCLVAMIGDSCHSPHNNFPYIPHSVFSNVAIDASLYASLSGDARRHPAT
jgi:hypothetical protein